MKISGTFDVALQAVESSQPESDGISMGRLTFSKTFHGGLEASSTGEMLSARTAVDGSAGYVALEQVAGRLGDHKGSFVLQHFGIMHAGQNRLILEVVPNSGSAELTGLTGTMKIDIRDGKHFYDFDYELPGN